MDKANHKMGTTLYARKKAEKLCVYCWCQHEMEQSLWKSYWYPRKKQHQKWNMHLHSQKNPCKNIHSSCMHHGPNVRQPKHLSTEQWPYKRWCLHTAAHTTIANQPFTWWQPWWSRESAEWQKPSPKDYVHGVSFTYHCPGAYWTCAILAMML